MEAGRGHPKDPGSYTLTCPVSSRMTDHGHLPTLDIPCYICWTPLQALGENSLEMARGLAPEMVS